MYDKKKFRALLDQQTVIILDGGLATELEANGYDLDTPLWSASLLLEDPGAIVDAHLAYLDAGAQIITTATYQASVSGFEHSGLSTRQADDLMIRAVCLAETAVTRHGQSHPRTGVPLVAASIGPYGAYLADGSEYKGHYGVDNHALAEFHRSRLNLLDNSPADILGCETIPSLQEAQVLAELLMTTRTPAWVSFSCRDARHLNDGSTISQAAGVFAAHPNVLAIGVNCTAPGYISGLIEQIKSAVPEKSIIVYPNSGEMYDAASKSWISTDRAPELIRLARSWHNQGAQIIGGCCRIGPEMIATLKAGLQS